MQKTNVLRVLYYETHYSEIKRIESVITPKKANRPIGKNITSGMRKSERIFVIANA